MDFDTPSSDANETAHPEPSLDQLLADLKARLGNAGIELREEKIAEGPQFEGILFREVLMPNGREKRRLSLMNERQMSRLLSIDFEKFTFLAQYDAIVSYQDDSIEALFRPIARNQLPSRLFKERLFKSLAHDPNEPIRISREGFAPEIVIGSMSKELRVLLGVPDQRESNPLTIKLNGFESVSHDAATATLERVTNSLFFQIDSQTGNALSLAKSRAAAGIGPASLKSNKEKITLSFPETEYDREPMTLYFYGRAAAGLPLLQFLAFYQVLEFFFPAYSETEARKRVQNILKNPGFNCHRDSDVIRVVQALRNQASRGFGDERSQLRATIQAIIEPEELREFISNDAERVDFFTKAKNVSKIKIPLANPTHDIRQEIAERIYDIRCKIVHSKSDDRESTDYLLPYSKEAAALSRDIEIVQFLANRALIVSSSEMR